MKYENATWSKRFLAYLVDSIIIWVVTSIILALIPAVNNAKNDLLKYINELLDNPTIIENNSEYVLWINDVSKCYSTIMGINFAVSAPIFIIYWLVIPFFWSKQTIGRLLLKVKVIDMISESKPTIGNLVLREFVGGYVLYNLLSCCCGITLILTIYYSVSKGRSLADMVGGTRLVLSEGTEVEEQNNDYIDASFKETSTSNEQNTTNDSANENPNMENKADDQYKINDDDYKII